MIRLINWAVLLLAILSALPAFAGETYYVRGTTDCPVNGNGTSYSCASVTGGAGAWSGVGNISYGTTASTFGRGDTIYICDKQTATMSVSGTGAFDGTANAATDIYTIKGTAANCGGTQGKFSGINGNAINMSSNIANEIADLTFEDITGSGINELYGTGSTCVATSPYRCSYYHGITCNRVGTSSGSCVNVTTSANTTFPTDDITGVRIEPIKISNVVETAGGGSACRIRLNVQGALIDNCKSTADGGYASNTWPVYASGVFLNCGTANSGAGITWTQVSGNLFKVSQTSCGAASGKIVVDVFTPIHGAGLDGKLTQATACTDDATCTTNVTSGKWYQVGDTLYVNRNLSFTGLNTATVNLTYGNSAKVNYNQTTIRRAWVEDPSDAYDGVGVGCDTGSAGCIIEGAFVVRAPGFAGIACGAAAYSCKIRSSIVKDATIAAITMGTDGQISHISTSGTPTLANVRTHTGRTITIINSIGQDLNTIAVDSLGEGTLTETNNSLADPGYIISDDDELDLPWEYSLKSTSAQKGVAVCYLSSGCVDKDFFGRRARVPPDRGAIQRNF